jgi:hypothetical protein
MNQAEVILRSLSPVAKKAADLDRKMSFGRQAKTMLMANRTNNRFGIVIDNTGNDTDLNVFLSLGLSATGDSNNKTFNAITGLGYATDADVSGIGGVLSDATVDAAYAITPKDANHPVQELASYCLRTPSQLTKLIMKSTDADGVEESSNFDNYLQAWHGTPFEKPVTQIVHFADNQSSKDTRVGLMQVDLLGNGHNIILGNESIVMVKVSANTKLSLDMFFGAQNSAEQFLFRQVNSAMRNLSGFYK